MEYEVEGEQSDLLPPDNARRNRHMSPRPCADASAAAARLKRQQHAQYVCINREQDHEC